MHVYIYENMLVDHSFDVITTSYVVNIVHWLLSKMLILQSCIIIYISIFSSNRTSYIRSYMNWQMIITTMDTTTK